jgi:hypothetical protein
MKSPSTSIPASATDRLVHNLEVAGYKWIFCASVSVFTFLFLLAFQPFGINNFDPHFRLSVDFVLAVGAIALVVFLTLAINEFVLRPLVLKAPGRRSLVAWLAWIYVLLGTVSFLFYNWLGDWHDLRWASYFGFLRDIGMMITLPIAGFLFYVRHESLKSEFIQLQSFRSASPSSKLVRFSSDNINEDLSVALDDLLYLESQDNYLAVVWLENGQPRSNLIRSTLKMQEESLGEPALVRCHRSFIVNLSRVRRCQGNRHGLKLGLSGTDRIVPVSRAYTSEILDRLHGMQRAD